MELQALNWLNIAQMNLFKRRHITVAVVDVGWMGVKCKLWVQPALFYSPIYPILLVFIHSSKNKTEKVDGCAVIFDGIQLSQMANNFQI